MVSPDFHIVPFESIHANIQLAILRLEVSNRLMYTVTIRAEKRKIPFVIMCVNNVLES